MSKLTPKQRRAARMIAEGHRPSDIEKELNSRTDQIVKWMKRKDFVKTISLYSLEIELARNFKMNCMAQLSLERITKKLCEGSDKELRDLFHIMQSFNQVSAKGKYYINSEPQEESVDKDMGVLYEIVKNSPIVSKMNYREKTASGQM